MNKKTTSGLYESIQSKPATIKKGVGKNRNAINTLTNAMKAKKARQELLSLANERANKTANKFSEID